MFQVKKYKSLMISVIFGGESWADGRHGRGIQWKIVAKFQSGTLEKKDI